jgi:hypothetical protein
MDESTYLKAARRKLLERRHAMIKELAASAHGEQLEAHLTMMVKVQSVLDILDKVGASDGGFWRSQKEGTGAI